MAVKHKTIFSFHGEPVTTRTKLSSLGVHTESCSIRIHHCLKIIFFLGLIHYSKTHVQKIWVIYLYFPHETFVQPAKVRYYTNPIILLGSTECFHFTSCSTTSKSERALTYWFRFFLHFELERGINWTYYQRAMVYLSNIILSIYLSVLEPIELSNSQK